MACNIMAKKKSYNPFTMWGSYVGLVSFLIYGQLAWMYYWYDINDLWLIMIEYSSINPVTHGLITTGILGFFIGWGIHSLFRFLRY